jgi:hypothetical protein
MVVLANYRHLDLRVARWLPTGDAADWLSAAGRQEMKLGSFFRWHFYWARGLWGRCEWSFWRNIGVLIS